MRTTRSFTTNEFTSSQQGFPSEKVPQEAVEWTRKKNSQSKFWLFPAGYLIGNLVGALFPVWSAADTQSYLILFFQNYLTRICLAKSPAELLGFHLFSQLLILFLIFFLSGCVYGTPALFLLVLNKGLVNGAVYTCILTKAFSATFGQFLLSYVLYDFGKTLLLLWAATVAQQSSHTLFEAFFKKVELVRSSHLLYKALVTVLCSFVWCLICWVFSQILFS